MLLNSAMDKTNITGNFFSQKAALRVLDLPYTYHNRQRLTYIRLGRKQVQISNGDRKEYSYRYIPLLTENTDWLYINGKVYYTNVGIEKLRDIFVNKRKIYVRENTL